MTFCQNDLNQIKGDISFLASDELNGRMTGTIYQDIAAKYIESRFIEIGISPLGDAKTYIQSFIYQKSNDPHTTSTFTQDSITIKNVIGFLDNQSNKTIVIGAHYDHLGIGDNGFSLSSEKKIHNGADDNASGVSAILQIASKLKAKKSAYNYLFIAFSGEELGLFGSNYFTKHPTLNLNKIEAMINLDMVGRLKNDNSILIGGVGSSPQWKEWINQTNVSKLKISFDESGTGPSDHTSFYYENIPVLFYFTGQHEDYHKPSDDIEKINFNGINLIVKNILALINRLEIEKSIPFQKTAEKKDEKMDFKVTLGIMPDYLYNEGGLRIDGVKENRPAHQAGMLKGDIILQIGAYPTPDIQAYMKVLNALSPGVKTTIEFIRDGKKIKNDIAF